jgi:CBS domain-containing protein
MSSTPDFSNMTVADVLETKAASEAPSTVLTAAPHDSIHDCIDRMVEHGIGSIVVVEDGEVAGIFTERDYMREVELGGAHTRDTPIQSVMTTDVETVTPDRSLEECLDRMHDRHCRHLPVVDADGQLSDILSMRDCLQ